MKAVPLLLIALLPALCSAYAGSRTADPVTNSIGISMVRIEAGTFKMGQDGPPLEDF